MCWWSEIDYSGVMGGSSVIFTEYSPRLVSGRNRPRERGGSEYGIEFNKYRKPREYEVKGHESFCRRNPSVVGCRFRISLCQ